LTIALFFSPKSKRVPLGQKKTKPKKNKKFKKKPNEKKKRKGFSEMVAIRYNRKSNEKINK
jgi:hypothetical protein